MNAKHRAASLLLGVLLAACGSTPATPTPAGSTPSASTPTRAAPTETATVEPSLALTTVPSMAAPTGTPTPAPSAAAPTSTPLPAPSPSLPVVGTADESSIRLAPRPDGGLFASIAAAGGTVLASLDRAGRLRPGWPIVLAGYSGCEIVADPADGSVRAVCATYHPAGTRAFAYDDAGRQLARWPADLLGNLDEWDRERPRLVDGQLYVITHSWNPPSATLVRVSTEGSVRSGANLWGLAAGNSPAWSIGEVAIGPDGTAYAMAYSDDHSATQITAVDLGGARPGWPIRIKGYASTPSFGPDGRLYLTVELPGGGKSRVVALSRSGKAIAGWPVELPIAAPVAWNGAGDVLAAPVVAPDGSAFVVAEDNELPFGGTTAYAIDGSGQPRAGWPYSAPSGLVWPGYCPPCTTGCGLWRSDPVAGPDGSLHLLHIGGSIVAVGTDGAVKAGWPVVLRRAGAEFEAVAVGADGTAYALAIEPERYEDTECETGSPVPVSSATIVAIASDGAIRYRTTIVSP